jgi:hypothetical protein
MYSSGAVASNAKAVGCNESTSNIKAVEILQSRPCTHSVRVEVVGFQTIFRQMIDGRFLGIDSVC